MSVLVLPEHTFYVDNIFVFTPLQAVKTMYYLPVDFIVTLLGEMTSLSNESVMIKRIDQRQLKVNQFFSEWMI